jgi:plasmid stability protein
MKSMTIKGVPEALLRELKARAKANRRSLNGEVIACLERVVRSRPRTADELLARVDAIRERVKVPYLTDEELNAAKRAGRL